MTYFILRVTQQLPHSRVSYNGDGGNPPLLENGGDISPSQVCCFEIVFSLNFYTSDTIFREKEACFHILECKK
jgi:hypothetical protein